MKFGTLLVLNLIFWKPFATLDGLICYVCAVDVYVLGLHLCGDCNKVQFKVWTLYS